MVMEDLNPYDVGRVAEREVGLTASDWMQMEEEHRRNIKNATKTLMVSLEFLKRIEAQLIAMGEETYTERKKRSNKDYFKDCFIN